MIGKCAETLVSFIDTHNRCTHTDQRILIRGRHDLKFLRARVQSL